MNLKVLIYTKPNKIKSKTKLYTAFLLVVIMQFTITCYSQSRNKVMDNLVEQFHKIPVKKAKDLVYLQTSKGIYETQEDLWFKGYVLDAQYFLPSIRSKILFVQLIEDQTDTVVWKEKYEIENGFTDGHIFLKDSLQEGSYTLTAFTSNSFYKDNKEFYASRKLLILKTIANKNIKAKSIQKDSVIQFNTFAEGGSLISEIPGTITFKAINTKGFPLKVSGTLYENNNPLLEFKSEHAGMGRFLFIPDSNKKYHIELSEPNLKKKYPLPNIHNSGKVLQLLSNGKEELRFKVAQSSTFYKQKVYLRIQLRGIVYSMAVADLKDETVIKIPLKGIPQGIAEVTLFNNDFIPIAERLVFVNHNQKLHIKTSFNKDKYTPREKVLLKIKATDQNGKPVAAHLGISVYDKIYQNQQDAKTIESHYHLSSQLKGKLYNPSYYFKPENKDRKKALDLLLLTQGWRSYLWTETNLKAEQNRIPIPVIKET